MHGSHQVSERTSAWPANAAARCQPATDLQPAAVQCQRAEAAAAEDSGSPPTAMQPSCIDRCPAAGTMRHIV